VGRNRCLIVFHGRPRVAVRFSFPLLALDRAREFLEMLIHLETLKALAVCADRESTRYALGGIKLERQADGAPIAIATDGRKMLAYTWVEPAEHPLKPADERVNPEFSALISAEALQQVIKWKLDRVALKRKPDLAYVYIPENASEEGFPISAVDFQATFRIENGAACGRFPRWRDVYGMEYANPDLADRASVAITLDPYYVAQLCAALAKLATSDDSRGVTLTIPRDPNRAALIRAHQADGRKAAAVIMPLAADRDTGRADCGQWHIAEAPADELEALKARINHLRPIVSAAEALADRLEALADNAGAKNAADHAAYEAAQAAELADELEAPDEYVPPADLAELAELAEEKRREFNALASRVEALEKQAAQVKARRAAERKAVEAAELEAAQAADNAEAPADSSRDGFTFETVHGVKLNSAA
jgi:hypothetical protein